MAVNTILVGNTDATITGTEAANTAYYTRFTASASGSMQNIKIKCSTSGNIKVAIYAEPSDGAVGARLTYNNTSIPVVAGWNVIAVPAYSIVSGTKYYLAHNCSAAGVVGNKSTSTGYQRYKSSSTFSTWVWPDPAGTGFSGGADNVMIAGYTIVPHTITGGVGLTNASAVGACAS